MRRTATCSFFGVERSWGGGIPWRAVIVTGRGANTIYASVYLSQAISTRKWRGIIPMGAQTRTDVLPYISLIPVFGYLWPGTSKGGLLVERREKA